MLFGIVEKYEKKEKVKNFIQFTNTGEKTAIYCLSNHDWKLDVASDAYFNDPQHYYKENSNDRKKIETWFHKYRGL